MKRKAVFALASVIAVLLIVLGTQYPPLAEILIILFSTVGLSIPEVATHLSDFAELARQPGVVGSVGSFLLAAAATFAVIKVVKKAANRLST